MLRADGITAGYGRTQILNGITLTVPDGGLVAMLGGNGTGKSTALKAIAGLVPVSSGNIVFDGQRIDGLPPSQVVRQGLSLVPQGKELFPLMSVRENLLMGGYIHRAQRTRIRDNLERVLAMFSRLALLQHRAAGVLSGGERQMLSIARALMSSPRLLMLDEPSAGLAPRIVEEIGTVIRNLHRNGLTILIVEQNVPMALKLAQYLYVIRDGLVALEKPVGPDSELEDLKRYYLG